ncbi:MAG: DNA polymerase IV, partial [Bacteroidota bacterium]|nr:DNA polymerase IV [Bacteroidota bacterium]
DQVLIKKVKEIFTKLYARRQLVRLVGVRFTDLIAGTYQINIFDDTQETIKLYQAIDSVKKQYGEKYIISAGGYNKNKDYSPYYRKF